MGRTIGIDLGTTNTAVAAFFKGRPKVIEDDKGYKVLPSVVSRKADGTYVVGQTAKGLILTEPDKTVCAVKRLIGRRFDSEEVQAAVERMPFHIEAGPDGLCRLKVAGQLMSPVDISAIILTVARQIAERALGEPVDEAVITVPAYFTHGQRAATMEAARLAGLRCDRLLNEPTAAALAYGHRKDMEKNILIFDLGGGTFDVSVLHISRGVYEVMSTSGDSYLGGEDFDLRIVDWLAERFLRSKRIDLRKDRASMQRLKDAAERAKCELSFQDRSSVLVPRITSKDNLEETLTRVQLEELVTDLIERSMDITRNAVQMAGLQLNEIDDVILVGGQSRMPKVREAISALFGKEPGRNVHPEEVVAIGAAVHAESLAGDEADRPLLIDVTPFDLGIDSAGGMFTTIVDRNSSVPITRTRSFTTAQDNQERVRITVRQGGSRIAKENEFLSEFILAGLRPAPRMEPKLDVTFRIDTNGMLHVSASDRATGERQQVVIRNYAESASDPHMPSPEQAEQDEARRAAERASSGGVASPTPIGGPDPAATGGLARLKGLFSRKSKPKEAKPVPPAQVVNPTPPAPDPDEPQELGGDALEQISPDDAPDDLDASAIESMEEPAAPTPRRALSSSAYNREEDSEALALGSMDEDEDAGLSEDSEPLGEAMDEDGDEAWASDEDGGEEDDGDLPTEQPTPGPARIGTAMRSSAEASVEMSTHRLNIRGLPTHASPVHETFDDGALAAAFLDELEKGELGGLDSSLSLSDGLDDLFGGEPLTDDEVEPPTASPDLGDDSDPFRGLDLFDTGDDPFADTSSPEPAPKAESSQEDLSNISVPRLPEGDPFAPFDDDELNAAFADGDPFADPDALLGLPDTDPFADLETPAPADAAPDPFGADDPFGEASGAGGDDPFAGLGDPFAEADPFASPSQGKDAETASQANNGGDDLFAEPAEAESKASRKPALLKVAYASASAFTREMQRNLEMGYTFIPSTRPLSEGRECVFELHVPGLPEPVSVDGVVIWSSRKRKAAGAESGMRVEYRPTGEQRARLTQVMRS